MNPYVAFIGVIVWGMFLVCIGTFGGATGLVVAGNAAGISAFLIVMYGILKFFEMMM